jgi:hypothetical protein
MEFSFEPKDHWGLAGIVVGVLVPKLMTLVFTHRGLWFLLSSAAWVAWPVSVALACMSWTGNPSDYFLLWVAATFWPACIWQCARLWATKGPILPERWRI